MLSGATIRRVFSNVCEKAFDGCLGRGLLASNPAVQIEVPRALWSGKITVYSSDDGVMEVLNERFNNLPAPFELEWHRLSGETMGLEARPSEQLGI